MRTLPIKIFVFIMGIFSFSCNTQAQNIPKSIYDFKLEGLMGDTIDLSQYKGKKIMIVNTASKCGLTPQYEALEKLYQTYKDDLIIIGIPSNNFMMQEPGSNEEIASFCQKNYGVSFPMAAKASVKGKNMHPLYHYLTKKQYNSFSDNSVKWNFQKYIFDEQGIMIGVIAPTTKPDDPSVIELIQKK